MDGIKKWDDQVDQLDHLCSNLVNLVKLVIAKKHCPILRHTCSKNPHGTLQIVIY